MADDDDVTTSLSNSVSSSLRVTCDGGSSECVEMLPAAGGVDSEDEMMMDCVSDKPPPLQRLST